MTATSDELERICMNCNHAFPSEPFVSDFAICLNDPEFEPYLDALLENQDFSRCQELVEQKRFSWEQGACPDFDPAEGIAEDVPLSPQLSSSIEKLARDGQLTAEMFQQAVLEDMVSKVDWANVPVDKYVEELNNAKTLEAREDAVKSLGSLVALDNQAALDALCIYLKDLPPPASLEETHLRVAILRQLTHTRSDRLKLAKLLVEDLFRTPSNNTTRGWYSAVFHFFEESSEDIAKKALSPMLDSPQFSYRIKKRVKGILSPVNDESQGYW